MSGGHFNGSEYQIRNIQDEIREELAKDDWNSDIKAKFEEAIFVLEQAFIYAHRIDWLLSGDDGEDNFIERLEKDLAGVADR